jgi:tetratricopeptide (TPR) repeat protein
VLFLDEVGLLPNSIQAKLLTAIEERAVRRLGSTRREPADAWLISATNTDLKTAIRGRRFRDDLYHRLAVFTIDLPPLRSRGRDILLLADRFLARACAEYRLPPKRLESAAEDRLLAYAWPGNVRELANVIERAALFADGAVIAVDALGLPPAERLDPFTIGSEAGEMTIVGRDERTEQRLLAALEETHWNISHTAARLGVARNTVYAWLEKFGLKPNHAAKITSAEGPRERPVAPPPTPDTSLRWERRTVTLLRAEICSSDNVDAWSQASRALQAVLAKMQSFGGRLEEISPTGLIAAFGMDSFDDAPRRAAHAALAIHRDVERARESGGVAPTVTVGLHVASLLIGRVGTRIEINAEDKRVHWPVVEGLTHEREPAAILVSAASEPFLERRFELTPLAGAAERRERVYRLAGRERHGLALWGSTTRFVGRQGELAALQTRLRTAASGHGQVVAVVGEAGVGKSRLVFELARSQHVAGCLVLETGSVSYGKGSSYFPVAGLFRRYFGIEDRDTHGEIRDRIVRKLIALDPALQASAPPFLMLLDTPIDDPQWQRLDPSQRRKQTFDAVKRLLRRESEIQPILVLFEDLHWIDSETQALLDSIVGSMPTMRVLLVLTYRPEYQHPWASQSYYTLLRVDPLPVDSTEELLVALLGSDPSLEALRGLLADKTGRNPLFIEESVRTLVEMGALRGQRGAYTLARPIDVIEVHTTVQAILAARIDHLRSDDKQLLEIAAVIGKDVPFALLRAVANESDEKVHECLGRLQMAEFLYETRVSADLEYTFKHALTHEVAYCTVPLNRCRELHARIAAAIEQVYSGRVMEHVERLAHHSVQAELWESAVGHLRHSGMKAVERHALRDAIAWFDQALAALSHIPPSRMAMEQAVDIRLERIPPVTTSLGDYRLVQEHLRDLEDIAQQLGDELRCGYVYRFKQGMCNQAGRLDEALTWGTRALDIARRLGARPLRILATTMLEQTYFMRGDYQHVVDLAYPNLAALSGDDERFGSAVLRSVYDRGWLVRSLAEMGRFREAAEPASMARDIAERLQDPNAISLACHAASSLYNWMGQWEMARSESEHGIEVLRDAGYVTTLSHLTALSSWAHARLGRPEAALRRAREAEALSDAAAAHARFANNSWNYFWLCRSYVLLGQPQDAERVLERVLEPPSAPADAFASYLRADIATYPHPPQYESSSEEHYRRAIALADDLNMSPLIANCHIGLARLFQQTGRADVANEQLGIATTMCRDLDMEPWLEPRRSAF